jgi:hypothetical protein
MENKILLDSSWSALHSGLDQIYICAVIHCAKLQEFEYIDKCSQVSLLANILNFCMHVQIVSSSSYKNFHK